MTAAAKRISTYTSASTQSDAQNGEQKKDLWTSMLDSVASGKRLPEKNILVLGGSPDTQREFLDSLSSGDQRRTIDRQRTPPVANNFALGYTYHDVLDADQEDTLARISLYLLSTPSPSFTTLLKPLLTPDTIPNTLVVVLLDWSQPTAWLRELQAWILMLRDILRSLDAACMDAMEDVMISWRDRGRGGASLNLDGTGLVATAAGGGDGGDAALPVGPGEWEDALGLPLCVVCQNADKMEVLEKSQGWKEADFDQILQYLRTILLRHGASLVYTTPHIPSQLQSLIHASLGVTSLIKRQPLKHNVIDRDKILVPPNWDSWGKIRVLREGFDVEGVSAGWSQDIERDWPFPPSPVPEPRKTGGAVDGNNNNNGEEEAEEEEDDGMRGYEGPSARGHYEAWVPDASLAGLHLAGHQQDGDGAGALEVVSEDAQEFLADQSRMLDAYKEQDALESKEKEKAADHHHQQHGGGKLGRGGRLEEIGAAGGSMVTDHIGPVQFNMGGIQVDADDMLQRLKDRQEYSANEDPTTPPGDAGPQPPAGAGLEAFFANLMNRRPGSSLPGSPSRGS